MNRDMINIAEDMLAAADSADDEGLAMNEYDEYRFPEEFRARVQSAMDRWENGCCDLRQAAQEMLMIAEEMPDE